MSTNNMCFCENKKNINTFLALNSLRIGCLIRDYPLKQTIPELAESTWPMTEAVEMCSPILDYAFSIYLKTSFLPVQSYHSGYHTRQFLSNTPDRTHNRHEYFSAESYLTEILMQ